MDVEFVVFLVLDVREYALFARVLETAAGSAFGWSWAIVDVVVRVSSVGSSIAFRSMAGFLFPIDDVQGHCFIVPVSSCFRQYHADQMTSSIGLSRSSTGVALLRGVMQRRW